MSSSTESPQDIPTTTRRAGYVMARTEQDVLTPWCPPSASPLDVLAESLTEVRSPQYEGQIPEPGQVVRGVVRGHSPKKGIVGPPDVTISVWVRAVWMTT